jgi:NADH-quinone oxidoreductase subunit F
LPDLKLLAAEPSEAERAAVDAVVGAEPADGDRVARSAPRRELLLPALRAAQRRVGWVSEGALAYVALRLEVAPADVYGVASFYALLSLDERPADVTHVCVDLACALKGAAVPPGAHPSPCLGLCELAPASLRTIAGERPSEIQYPEDRLPAHGDRLLGHTERGAALARARELGVEGVLDAIEQAGLLGRGGAAFPTAAKWRAVAAQRATPHYVVCNADESEPGTFKDRVLLEEHPDLVVEGLAIAMYATHADRAFVYIRAEYPRAQAAIRAAVDAAGLDIELRIGAGAYVCGEETALFASIEGYRGEPRSKPPFPVEAGLFGKPTAVNNVETLANVPLIVLGDARPTRLFCVSGDVARPGLYERELGTPLRELLDDAGAEPAQAVLLGGAAGVFLGPEQLDVALDFDVTLGSGVVMVFGEAADLGAAVTRIAEFFRDESCGQCVPCRIGTVRQVDALRRNDRAALVDLAQVMRDASICGLGQTAGSAVQSALELLP